MLVVSPLPAIAGPAEAGLPQQGEVPGLSGIAEAEVAEGAGDTLGAVIAQAYEGNPLLVAQRYELRAADDALGLVLSGNRATVRAELSSGYRFTDPGDITQAGRSPVDRLNEPYIHDNDIGTQIVVDQPLSTGGKVPAEIAAARGDIRTERQRLRGSEGDLLLDVITAYVGIRHDLQALEIWRLNENALARTLDEVAARREAGELTQTDVAQATTQLQSARAQRNVAEAQLEDSRAAFAALVGREPGRLAPEPLLPGMPKDMDEAFETAAQFNPDLAMAIEGERASRARIASVRADRRPALSLRGTAGTTGPVSPFERADQDLFWSGRLTLSLPLSAGGRTAAGISQALNRNSADRLRIEAARRRMVQQLIAAWNQMATAQRNREVQEAQVRAGLVYYEGTFEEYRAGLRSTFDVLFAQNALRDSQIALIGSRRDHYVAQAALLRRLGTLEAASLLKGGGRYDPDIHLREAEKRGALPWDPVFRAVDRFAMPGQSRPPLRVLTPSASDPAVRSGATSPGEPDLIRHSPMIPLPDTTATPAKDLRP